MWMRLGVQMGCFHKRTKTGDPNIEHLYRFAFDACDLPKGTQRGTTDPWAAFAEETWNMNTRTRGFMGLTYI